MEGVGMLLFLCITMLIGSFVAGLVPLALTLSENKMRHLTILGAGLLIGTALAVIIPEGIIALYADTPNSPSSHHHVHKRSLMDDDAALQKFLYQQSESSNIQDTVRNRVLSKRDTISDILNDEEKMRMFAFQRGETINTNRVLSKRHASEQGLLNDQEAAKLFLYQKAHNNNQNQVLDSSRIFKRDLETAKEQDERARLMFLYEQAHNNNVNQIIDPVDTGDSTEHTVTKRDLSNADALARRMFLYQQAHNNNINQVAAKKRDISKRSYESDRFANLLFLYQKDHNNNLPVVRAKRGFDANDANAKSMFLYQQTHNNNVNQVIDSPATPNDGLRFKRDTQLSDRQASGMFLLQKAHNNNLNQVYESTVNNNRRLRHVSKRDTFQDLLAQQIFASRLAPNNNLASNSRFKRETESDRIANRMFLLQKAHNNNQIEVGKKRRLVKRDDSSLLNDEAVNQLFLNQKAHNNNQNEVYDDSISNLDDKVIETRHRTKRAAVNDPNQSNQVIHKVEEPIKSDPHHHEEKEAHEAGHAHESNGLQSSHSAIGITLVLGFVFMLIVDQIGGKFSHRHTQSLDPQAIRSKISFVTTLGLVVHAAADGIALGAAAATTKTDVEMIVFAAIMLHKAPAAFGLVSFLIHEGLDRIRVRRHLTIFALAAPVMAILTFLILSAQSDMNVVDSKSTGLCMLFSAGTFLYVSTVHVLPEVQAHNEDRQFRPSEMFSFIIGAIMPLFLSMGHSH